MSCTLAEVLEYGPIVASDDELGLLVTGNGAYYTLWVSDGRDMRGATWTNTDCKAIEGDGSGMYGVTAATFWDGGKAALADWLLSGCDECGDQSELNDEGLCGWCGREES